MMHNKIVYNRLNPPERTLLGADLSNASPRSRQGLIGVLQGAADSHFLKVLEEARTLLRHLWQTENVDTFLIPGSEENALECALFNVLEPDDTVVVGITGFFGERMAQVIERQGCNVVRVSANAGMAPSKAAFEDALAQHSPKLLAILHGDGSTGVEQPLDELGALAHQHGGLLLVDSRWTIGALPLEVDALEIDICVAGSQKALSSYPGLGLVTFSSRATRVYDDRSQPTTSWLYDLDNLRQHHLDERAVQTMPAPIVYALTEMLQLVYEQGMAYRIQRHVNRRDSLVLALELLGLRIYADPAYRLPTVTGVHVPPGVDQNRVRQRLLRPFRIDIGGGLGELDGKLWRVGVMGHSAQPSFYVSFLTLLEIILTEEGYPISERGTAVPAFLNNLDP